ncbi:hypothetical protein SAMN05519103_05038 [Rhizobiales bacterium GAS113]|nr:hypothetical protein SAMN05519103_05038 [Rhizobiales bacterium GAS113]
MTNPPDKVAWRRSPDELRAAFEIQRQALAASCASFDSGNKWEAIRLAATVHTLVHDQGKSYKSILTQMGIRGSLRFLSSGRVPERSELGAFKPLVVLQIHANGTAEYLPKFENYNPRPHINVQFHDWWEDERIFRDSQFVLSRKRLVFELRNKEGGAHLSSVIDDPSYVQFSRTSRTFVGAGSDLKPVFQSDLASMRQIAWELTKTLEHL